MLRVTVKHDGPVEAWELEGRLSGEWAKELERCWRQSVSNEAETQRQIHLKSVSYIDAEGKRLLSEMHRDGAEIKACGCMARAVVEELVRAGEVRAAGEKDVAMGPSPSRQLKAR